MMQSFLIAVSFSSIRLLSRCQPLRHLSGHQRASGGAQCLLREHLSWVLLIIWLRSFFWENHTVRGKNCAIVLLSFFNVAVLHLVLLEFTVDF